MIKLRQSLTRSRWATLLALVVCILALPAFGQPWAGSGDANDPYQIWDANDMQTIGADANYWDAHFLLCADIDLGAYTGTSFNIIGTNVNAFTGTFEGNGHEISNFSYVTSGTSYVGIFGYVRDANAEIRDLGLIAPSINAADSYSVGSLVGKLSNGRITDCYVNGASISAKTTAGGLVGNSRGTLIGCSVTGTVAATASAGGLVGANYGTVSHCNTDVNVSAGNRAGGLVGYNSGSTFNSCATGVVSGWEWTGGLVGQNDAGVILGCYAACSVEGLGGERIGVLVGFNDYYSMILDCYASGSVYGTTGATGGLVGCNGSTISRCYATSEILSSQGAGLVGLNVGVITDSFWDENSSNENKMCAGQCCGGSGCDNSYGKTTAEMQDPNTFLDAGWDFVGEYENGPSDIWAEPNGGGYPVLWWELAPWPELPDFSGGTGQANDPYLLSTATGLNRIGQNPRLMAAHFKLASDIDLTGIDFFLIGSEPLPFTGVFDGNSRTIWNFTHESNDVSYVGLFRYIDGENAEIKDLGLAEPNIDAGNGSHVGSLVGYLKSGAVTGCHVERGSVSGNYKVGGLVGATKYGAFIFDSYTTSSVIATDGEGMVAGLVGENHADILDCYSNSNVIGGNRYVGGLLGWHSAGMVSNCHASGSVSGGELVGGLTGGNVNGGLISACYSTADVSGDIRVGGLVGYNGIVTSLISNCYAKGNVMGVDRVGGLVGENRDSSFSKSYSSGEVSGVNDVGGAIGYDDSGDYTSCFWDNTVNAGLGGIGNTTHPNVVGESTANMQTESTYTSAGWDFVGESANGTDDIWIICNEGYNYPRLWWEQPRVYHVNIIDGNDNNNGVTPATAFATIQVAINKTCDSELVHVWPGLYTEAIDFLGKAITVAGISGAPTLEAPGNYAVSFYHEEDANSVFRNFVVRDSLAGFLVLVGSPTIKNVTVVNNGTGVVADDGAVPNISNSIFWNNTSGDLFQCQARYSCIESDANGVGNISEDPLFVDLNGDYHLKSEGWRWNENVGGGSSWTWDSVTSRCIDAGNPGSALGDELLTVPRDPDNVYGINVRINMGAYGGTAEASIPPHGWAFLADLNSDGIVNFVDFAEQAADWLTNGNEYPGDLNWDGVVNMPDCKALAEDWLQATDWTQ